MNAYMQYVWNDRSGKSVVKAALTFVIASIVIGTLTGTGFQLTGGSTGAATSGAAGSAAGAAGASAATATASSFGTFNVLRFGTTNFLPVPFWGGGDGGDGGGGDSSGGSSRGGSTGPTAGSTSDGIPTIPYDPVTKEVLVDYTNPVTGEKITKGTKLPENLLNQIEQANVKLYQRTTLSDPQLPTLNTPTTKDGFYNQAPPSGSAPKF